MKATGIVRRIDDLGRVVIPKELRRAMRIREGDPLEIFTDRDGEVIFKKYSPIGELGKIAAQYAETLAKTCNLSVAVTDRDVVIAAAGVPKKDYLDKAVSKELDGIMASRQFRDLSERQGAETIRISDDVRAEHSVACASPIISEGDVIGCVVSLRAAENVREKAGETEKELVKTASSFLGRQLED